MNAAWIPASAVHLGDAITQDGADRPVQRIRLNENLEYVLTLTGGVTITVGGHVELPVVSTRAAA